MPLLKTALAGQLLPGDAERLGVTLERFITAGPSSFGHDHGDLGCHDAQALEAVLKAIHEAYAPAVFSGTQLLQQLEQSRLLPTGCTSIDQQVLRGGLREGQMTEFCGETASGKTQLCLMAAAHAAARGERAVYIDTSNAFSARRLLPMLAAIAGAREAVGEVLARITVHRAYDVHAVLSVLDSLLQQPPPGPSLVIVDSLSAVIAPVLGGGGGQHSMGHALLTAAAASLKCLALRAGAAVIVTNHMVGGGEGGRGEKRPAMGESWKSQPHVRILLSPAIAPGSAAGPAEEGEGRYVATLRASTWCPPGAQATYWLGPSGVVTEPPH